MNTTHTGTVLRHLRELTGPGGDQPADRELLERFARGDAAAFEGLVRRHGAMVLGVCRRVLGNAHDAEDAFQATFLALARSAATVGRGALAGWLYRVAYHNALRARSATAARAEREQRAGREGAGDPLEEVTGRELLAVLDEELRALPERHRAPLVLCYLQGCTRDEAARQLGWSDRTLRRRLGQGRDRLRQRLQRRGVGLPALLLAAGLAHGGPAARTPATLVAVTLRRVMESARPAAVVLAGQGLSSLRCVNRRAALGTVLALGLVAIGAGTLAIGRPAAPRVPQARSASDGTRTVPSLALRASRAATLPAEQGRPAGKVMPVTGRVLDADGKPVPGANVAVVVWPNSVVHEGDPPPTPEVWARGRTKEDGRFELNVPRPANLGAYRRRVAQIALVANRDGHGLGWHFLRLDADKADAQVRLRPEQVLRGRILDVQGQPAPGVQVAVLCVGKPAPRYQSYHLWAEDERVEGQVGVKSGEDYVQLWNEQTALAFWEEEVRFGEVPEGLAPWPRAVRTDAAGRFSIRGVGRDQRVIVRTRGSDRVASEDLTFARRPEARPAEVTFPSAAPCLIEGRVTDAETGRPLARARVQVEASGSASFPAPWPLPADWKGRQGLIGQGVVPSGRPSLGRPTVHGLTDADGRFRLSPFRNWNGSPNQFSVIVSGPDGQPYLTVKKSVRWRKGAQRQEASVALPRGVLVRGQVSEAPFGKPLPGLRVDFYSKTLPLPPEAILELRPDGVFHPPPRRTDGTGRFEVVVPPGRGHLLVNAPGTEYAVTRVAADDLGVTDGEESGRLFLPPGKRTGKKHHYYPDAVVVLDHKAGTRTEAAVALRRAPVLRGRVLGPDGKPASGVKLFTGQEPFKELSHGAFARKYEVRDGQFEVPVRNPEAPLWLAFLDAKKGLGAAAAFTSRQAAEGPVTVRLAPCGRVTARFVDAKKKPLAGYRPLLWLSLPAVPYSAAQDLERLGTKGFWHFGFDAVWVGAGDPRHYGNGPRTDAEGRVTLPALIPGATYRLSLSGGQARDFKPESGRDIDLGDLTVANSKATRKLPTGK